MLCSFCNLAFHPRCLAPPLERIPEQEWACPACAKQFRRRKKRYNNVDSVKEENERLKMKLEQLNANKRKREEKEREVEERKRRRRREENERREQERREKEEAERKRREAEEEKRQRMRPWTQDEAQEWYDRKWIIGNPKYFEETKFASTSDLQGGVNDGTAKSSSDPRRSHSSSSSSSNSNSGNSSRNTSDPRRSRSSGSHTTRPNIDPRHDPRASSSHRSSGDGPSANVGRLTNDPRMRSTNFDPRFRTSNNTGGAMDPRRSINDPRSRGR